MCERTCVFKLLSLWVVLPQRLHRSTCFPILSRFFRYSMFCMTRRASSAEGESSSLPASLSSASPALTADWEISFRSSMSGCSVAFDSILAFPSDDLFYSDRGAVCTSLISSYLARLVAKPMAWWAGTSTISSWSSSNGLGRLVPDAEDSTC